MSNNRTLTDELMELVELQKNLQTHRYNATVGTLQAMIEEIKEAREEMREDESKKVFYDAELGETISNSLEKLTASLTELVKGLKPQLLDLSPIGKSITEHQQVVADILSSMKESNDALLKAIIAQAPVQSNNSETVQMIRDMIDHNTEIIEKKIVTINYSKELQSISSALNSKSRPQEWQAEILREFGKISGVRFKPL